MFWPWNFQWVAHNFADFPGVKASFLQNFYRYSDKSKNSRGFQKSISTTPPVWIFFWNSTMNRWVSSKKSNNYFSSTAIETISEKNSKQGGGLRTWNFLRVYWKDIMWKFQRSIKKRFGISKGNQESLGFWKFHGVEHNFSRGEGPSIIVSGIFKDKLAKLKIPQFFFSSTPPPPPYLLDFFWSPLPITD